jgi:hypothetical protein
LTAVWFASNFIAMAIPRGRQFACGLGNRGLPVKIKRAVSLSGVVFLAGVVVAGIPVAWADDCTLASDAAIAQAKVPHAVTRVTSVPGKPAIQVEMIFLGDRAYTQTNGTWRSVPDSAQDQIETISAARKRAEQTPHTCQKVGGGPINGEATALIAMHSETNGKASDARIWISDNTGLPLKSEIHLSSGTVITDDFRYTNIEAPPGAK